ncbi:MAG: hypothetical protein ACTHQ3_06960 [Motilibacteraceae bacterium]
MPVPRTSADDAVLPRRPAPQPPAAPAAEPDEPVVELGFTDGRSERMPAASPQAAALLAAATRLLQPRD